MNHAPGTPAAQPPLQQGLAAEPIDEAVFATQLHLAYERLPQSALMTVGVVVIFTILLTPFFPLQMALGWVRPSFDAQRAFAKEPTMPIIRRLIGSVVVLASFEIGWSAFAEELVNQGSGNPGHALKVFAKFVDGQQAQHRMPVPPSMRRG